MIHHEGTFGDYFSMKPSDNVYFFIQRKIYGIGELVEINTKCKSLNYPGADIPKNFSYIEKKDQMILDESDNSINNRCICFFKPSPYFFETGIDMDDVLSSDPERFKMLRALWKVSFIKIDDKENKALRDIILIRNEQNLIHKSQIFPNSEEIFTRARLLINDGYDFSHNQMLSNCSSVDYTRHEMAIEASLLDILSNSGTKIFGRWDYVSHQVVASPFKAIDYMDKMDIFGYRYIPGYDAISKYLCIEIKKDTAHSDVLYQIMKYVDWINTEYSHGNYSMIEAFIVAYDFDDELLRLKNEICVRNYAMGMRPTILGTWTNLRLIKYSYDESTTSLSFTEVL